MISTKQPTQYTRSMLKTTPVLRISVSLIRWGLALNLAANKIDANTARNKATDRPGNPK